MFRDVCRKNKDQQVNAAIAAKLNLLRTDYSEVRGHPFNNFYCPILFKDEDVPLCKAHIVNEAFPDSAPDWTIQRKDVDNFYGSVFESDFLAFQYYDDRSIDKVLTDKKLSKRLRPKILLNDESIDYFVAGHDMPEEYTRLDFEHDGQVVQFGLKMPPEDVLAATDQKWEVEVSKDIRVAALVSLIKAGHLTLFEMLGYRYALSAGGYFIGRQILGNFFVQNYSKPKQEVLENALPYFQEFANLVRPLQVNSLNLEGTITDKLSFLCGRKKGPYWALILFVKSSKSLSAVMIPILDNEESAARFANFLKNDNENIEATYCRLEQGQWMINNESSNFVWPKTGILYPE
jgi:hypothetical protein